MSPYQFPLIIAIPFLNTHLPNTVSSKGNIMLPNT